MNDLFPIPEDLQGPLYLASRESSNTPPKKDPWILQWWYRMTSPPELDDSAPFHERELFRRGRTGSQISIILFLLILISYPAAFAGSNSLLIIILTINLLFLAGALVLNRLRKVNIAGFLVVLGVVVSPVANILTTPGGVNTSTLPIFGFLVLPLMCTVSFLPPAWVFVVALANCLFTVYVLRFMPNSGELHQVLKVAFVGIVTPIVLSQVIVSVVAFLWVRGARSAILRADGAEEVARLTQNLLERDRVIAVQKAMLDTSIQQIEQVLGKVANGDMTPRVPFTPDNVLWSISGKINNLLARYQSLLLQVKELQQSSFSLQHAQEDLRRIHGRNSTTSQRSKP